MVNIYAIELKQRARLLRKSMTEPEIILWSRLRRKQVLNVKFLRQKSVECFILDFYAPQIKLAIELDGGQHFDSAASEDDIRRDRILSRIGGILTLRYSNNEIMRNVDNVLGNIYFQIQSRI